MRLGSKIQALLRRALTGDRQGRGRGIRPARRRERGQFVVVDCMKRPAGYRGAAPRGQEKENMNKGEMADRLAARTGLSKAAARDAVDGMLATIGEALLNGEEVPDRGIRELRHQEPAGPYRPQPEDRRNRINICVEVSRVQGRQDAQGCGERGSEAVTS